MADPLRNVDQAYYGSKKPLDLRATREGSKNPATIPSYRHRPGDMTASSNKYYASAQVSVSAAVSKPAKLQIIKLDDSRPTLPRVVAAFGEAATRLELHGNDEQVRSARNAIDMAVGRNTLTRVQADAVDYVVVITAAEQPSVAPTPDMAIETSDTTTETLDTVPQIEALTEEEALMPPPPKQKKSKSKKKHEVTESDEAITEADVAAAFGVVEEGDD